MKIGIQILAYNCAESFPTLFEPWLNLKEEFNFDFWVGSGQFKIYNEMGCEDLNDSTIEMLQSRYSDVIDHLFIPGPDNLLSDHEMRSQCLKYFEEKDVDLIWILDADEFYTEEEIRRSVDFVLNNPQYDHYRIPLKNFVGDKRSWTLFEPMRIVWSKRYGGIKSYYWDNHFSYNDDSEYRSHASITLPKEEVFPLHYSWVDEGRTTGPKSLKDKIEYQKKYYNDGCGYRFNDKTGKIECLDDRQEEREDSVTTQDVSVDNNKKILLKVTCVALGDTLCSTPTIRKVYQCYGHKVSVQTYQPYLFKNNPYVDAVYTFDESVDETQFDEIFETYNQWIKTNQGLSSDIFDRKIEIKLSNFEARQMHALGVGLYLYPNEMSYDYIPEAQAEKSKNINKGYIALHITKSWPNRTWSDEQWQRLVDLVKDNTDFKIVLIGRSHKEMAYFGDIDKEVINLDRVDLDYCIRSDSLTYQENNSEEYDTISELWHVINNSLAVISFDGGPIHLAGTTDSHIIQIGASVDPRKTAPYRKGSQGYKFHYVGGECKKFCATDPKYSVREWGTINSMPYYPVCQEKYAEFKCQPTPEQVFFAICNIQENSEDMQV